MCRLAKQKSNKANLSNLYPGRRVILEKLTNHKTYIQLFQLLSGVCKVKVFASVLVHTSFPLI